MAVNEELVRFVREALGRGMPRADIGGVLTGAGWPSADVRAALGAFADVDCPVPVPRPRPSLNARDAFLYLTLFMTLYISAYNLGLLTSCAPSSIGPPRRRRADPLLTCGRTPRAGSASCWRRPKPVAKTPGRPAGGLAERNRV